MSGVVADRFFPSSKRCSVPGCGFINDNLFLSVREWECPNCKTHHDRDHNASVNLDNYGRGDPVETRYSSTGSPRP
ncbi:zinc ribbon domain-containing protein [Endozoicomonas sp. YOMI1]|uniref:zinc ribbon domain-containing protein n=1 Tax=Endozoicomonas sp. YOMI1 TaxID=2828739 RepID=UPI0035A06D10